MTLDRLVKHIRYLKVFLNTFKDMTADSSSASSRRC